LSFILWSTALSSLEKSSQQFQGRSVFAGFHNDVPNPPCQEDVFILIFLVKLDKNVKEKEDKMELTSGGLAMRFYALRWRRATQSELMT